METVNYLNGDCFWLFAAGIYVIFYFLITMAAQRRRDKIMREILNNSIRQGVNYSKYLRR